jgi:sugar lactone lactonase YvrE
LESGIAYYFRVSSIKNGVTSTPFTTSSAVSTTFAPPTNLTTSNVTANSVVLNWSNSISNLADTLVEYNTALTGTWTTFTHALLGSATTITVTGLNSETSYYFRVSSIKNSLTSMPSTPSSVALTLVDPYWNRVVTVAGFGPGYADGVGTSALFYSPQGMASDSSGNVYVAEYTNHRIRKITPQGVVTTIAGSGSAAFADGTGTGASFNQPRGVAVDSIGNLYVSDGLNRRIRKITPQGVVTTLAGNGTSGTADGTGAGASFQGLNHIAIYEATGELFVVDAYRIRKVTQLGVVSLLAGSTTYGNQEGTGAGASFYSLTGIAVASDGTVIVADTGNSRIRRITQLGVTSLLAGSSSGFVDDIGVNAKINQPLGIAFESGGTSLIFADNATHRVRRVTYPEGVVTTIAGNGTSGYTDGIGSSAAFSYPTGIAVGAGGNVLVSHSYGSGGSNYHIIRGVIKTASQAPTGLTTSNPTLYSITLTWTNNSTTLTDTLVEYQPASGSWTTFTHNTLGSGNSITVTNLTSETTYSFRVSSTVYGVTVAGPSATASGTTSNSIQYQVSTLAGSTTSGFLDGTGSSARFSNPRGVAVDSNQYVFVADTNFAVIRRVSPDGVVVTIAGIGGSQGYADGVGSSARFDAPFGISIDSNGNIIVVERFNKTIRMIKPPTGGWAAWNVSSNQANVVTIAGAVGVSNVINGPGLTARFVNPLSLVVSSDGYIFATDGDGIRMITPPSGGWNAWTSSNQGTVYTIVVSSTGFQDGPGTGTAKLYEPVGIDITSDGYLFVADTKNNRIRMIPPPSGGWAAWNSTTNPAYVYTIAGGSGSTGTNGAGNVARFYWPSGITINPTTSEIYLCDINNAVVRLITPPSGGWGAWNSTTNPAYVYTVAGNGSFGTADGTNSIARFAEPASIALNKFSAQLMLFVADTNSNGSRIRKIVV